MEATNGQRTKGQIFEIKSNNSRDNDHVYLESIRKEIENVDFLKSMFKYYSTLDISNFDVNKIPKTTNKEKQHQKRKEHTKKNKNK